MDVRDGVCTVHTKRWHKSRSFFLVVPCFVASGHLVRILKVYLGGFFFGLSGCCQHCFALSPALFANCNPAINADDLFPNIKRNQITDRVGKVREAVMREEGLEIRMLITRWLGCSCFSFRVGLVLGVFKEWSICFSWAWWGVGGLLRL